MLAAILLWIVRYWVMGSSVLSVHLSTRDNFLSIRDNFPSIHDNVLPIYDNFLSTDDNFLSIHDNLLSCHDNISSVTKFFLHDKILRSAKTFWVRERAGN